MKGGLSVLSIGTAPLRARWTEGMRYIVKPKNKISAETRKKAQQALPRGVQPPVKNRGEITNVRNLSRTKTETKEKKRLVVLSKLESKPLDNTSCIYPSITSCFQTSQSYRYHNKTRLLPKTNIRNVKSNLKSSYNMKYNLSV